MDKQKILNNLQHARKYACTFCESSFSRKDRLERHLFLHTGSKDFKCEFELCDKSYTNSSHLKRHIRSCHTSSKPKINSYPCKYKECMQGFTNVSNRNRHYRQFHIIKTPYTCDHCMSKFRRKIQIKRHFKESHNIGSYTYLCAKCDKGFFNKFSYSKHITTHKYKECGICNEVFENWSQLVAHRKVEHKPKDVKFECDLCGKIFCRKPNIKQHMKGHLMKDSVYSCNYENCSKFYTVKRNLVAHIRSKHEGKKFLCHICNIKLSSKQKLQNHIDAHSDPIKSKYIKKPNISLILGIQVHQNIQIKLPSNIDKKKNALDPAISTESEFSDN